MALIRKLDETAETLLELAKHIKRTALEVADDELRAEMLESAEGLERRAGDMAEAVGRLRTKIN
jgi:hypothetical protein